MVVGDGRKTCAVAALAATLALLSPVFAVPTQAAERVALVVGNAAYAHAPRLANPLNDAAAVGAALARLGYSVTKLEDADHETLHQGLGDFALAASASEVALVFYAGHGIEVDKHNFLVPVDAELASDQSVEYEAVRLELVTNAVRGASALRLVILDACRENPFAVSMQRARATRSIGRGLGRVEPAGGTIVAYAAKEGTVAADGEGLHSPYTTALLHHLEEPRLDVGRMLRRVRDAVLAATGGRQEPVLYGSLPGRDVYLSARAASPLDPPSGVEPGAVPARTEAGDAARAAYEAAERAHTIAAYQAVVKNFPGDFYADLARARIEELEERAAASMSEEEDMTEASPESSPALVPASLPADEETPLDAGAHADRIDLSFVLETWLEVYGNSDERLFYGLAQSGERLGFSGRGPIRVVVGNSEGMEVRYNGTPVDFSAFTRRGVARFSVGGDPPQAFRTPLSGGAEVSDPAGVETSLGPALGYDPFAYAEASLHLEREEVEWIQRGLASEGYTPGPVDGWIGKNTRAALSQWQRSRGMPETGYLDVESARDLLALGGRAEARRKAEEERNRKEREAVEARRRAALAPEMVRIRGGCFQMGSPAGEKGREHNERQHRVCVEDFSMGRYEVTFEEYDRFVEATGRKRPLDDRGWGRGRRPVINVSWGDAIAYARWLSGVTGKRYRLPTEAEWEYAARAGSTGAYPWGDSLGRNRANCRECGSRWDGRQTAPVGSFAANAWDLHDTVGNVREWTCSESCYESEMDRPASTIGFRFSLEMESA